MNWFTKILNRVGLFTKNQGLRLYAAGQTTRLNNDFSTTQTEIDRDIRHGIAPTRARARTLARNNAYIKGYLTQARVNIVGPEGFKFQNRAKKFNLQTKQLELNEFANDIIEQAWRKWTKAENCTMRGTWSFLIVQHLIVQQLKRDGEFLARMITGRSAKNDFGFSLELLETDSIDERYNEELANGNVVKMGVEYNEWRRPVAYWLKKKTIKDELTYSHAYYSERYRVPADEILFGFDPEHPKQSRAVSPLVQTMLTVNMFDGWEEGSIVNARAAAEKMGFLIQKRLDADEYEGEKDESDAHINEFEPGIIEKLPFGYEFQGWDPKFPSDQHEPFTRSLLRKIATALGMNYASLANDRSQENYSSLREGKLKENDVYMLDQSLFRELFLIPLFNNWLKYSLLSGALRPLTIDEYDSLNQPEFSGRRWQWVDPMKEAQAYGFMEDKGYTSRKKIIEQTGGNKEEIDIDIEKDKPVKEKLGLTEKRAIKINGEAKNNEEKQLIHAILNEID